MKANIHPDYRAINVNCSGCSSEYTIMSTFKQDSINVEFCCHCHSAWTGKKTVSSKGKVEQFNTRYGGFSGMLKDKTKKS
ncbi:MAG: 50S ribosomal protein L31 [Legionellales bacterium]|nr:50S ribosomal protein L31 [Legionellales bacterium]|tara:strand:- start:973 stop:1212 length:240 start_codon:yes stop_codon:yes gene_type:complete